MNTGTKTANAVGGKTARACDSCIQKRARWYWTAEDAFLCQSCDASVHSANHLAGQHQRVRLETASLKLFDSCTGSPEPTWHQGFTRRARTPRSRIKSSLKLQRLHDGAINSSIPEKGSVLDASLLDDDDEDEQLLYRVPVFDPFAAELCNASHDLERNETFVVEDGLPEETCNLDDLQGFDLLTDDLKLQEFAADVESLLGKGFEDQSCGIEGLGLNRDCKEEDGVNKIDIYVEENRMKVEHEEVKAILGCDLDVAGETFDWDFDYESTMMIREEHVETKVAAVAREEHMMTTISDQCKEDEGMKMSRSSILLRLNYDEVINAWADQGSPWTIGAPPEVSSRDRWPDFMMCIGVQTILAMEEAMEVEKQECQGIERREEQDCFRRRSYDMKYEKLILKNGPE